MMKVIQATADQTGAGVKAAGGTVIGSSMAYFGVDLSVWFQGFGALMALISATIYGLHSYAMWRQRKRELDIEERKLKGK